MLLHLQTVKRQTEAVLRYLPDDCSLEDIQYHLYVLEKIRKGRQDVAKGCCFTHEEAKERLGKWRES